jgi:hypothetical protein
LRRFSPEENVASASDPDADADRVDPVPTVRVRSRSRVSRTGTVDYPLTAPLVE